MKTIHRATDTLLALLLVAFVAGCATTLDPLPSWNQTASKAAIVEFVGAVTDKNGKDYVEASERITGSLSWRVLRSTTRVDRPRLQQNRDKLRKSRRKSSAQT